MRKHKNKTTKNEKTKQEIKERVRGTYLSATSGAMCWARSYAAGAALVSLAAYSLIPA